MILSSSAAYRRAKKYGLHNKQVLIDHPYLKGPRLAAFEAVLEALSCAPLACLAGSCWKIVDAQGVRRNVPVSGVIKLLGSKQPLDNPALPRALALLAINKKFVLEELLAINISPAVMPGLALAMDEGLSKYRLTISAARFLAKKPIALRFALLKDVTSYRSRAITLASLNFEAYAKAKTSKAFCFSCLPLDVAWGRLAPEYPYFPVPGMTLEGFKVSTYKQVMALCSYDKLGLSQARGLHSAVFSLTRLFGDKQSIMRFVAAHVLEQNKSQFDADKRATAAFAKYLTTGDTSVLEPFWAQNSFIKNREQGLAFAIEKAIHDAGQFNLPTAAWTPSAWAPLMLRTPRAVRYLHACAQLEKAGLFPSTLKELKAQALELEYPPAAPGYESLRELCLRHELPADHYLKYESFWKYEKPKAADFMPFVEIDGSQVGLDGYMLKKLNTLDPLGPMLGAVTGCCQHLMSAGEASARAGVLSPFSGFYVVLKGKEVVAQSWAWRSTKGAVVLDSVESIHSDPALLSSIAKLYQRAAKSMLGALQVDAVFLGATTSGVTAKLAKCLKLKAASSSQKPVEPSGYFDGKKQHLLAGAVPNSEVLVATPELLL